MPKQSGLYSALFGGLKVTYPQPTPSRDPAVYHPPESTRSGRRPPSTRMPGSTVTRSTEGPGMGPKKFPFEWPPHIPPSTSGGGGGPWLPPPSTGGRGPAVPAWSEFESGIQGAPMGWKALKPSGIDARSDWLSSLNLMLPFLAPNDQQAVAQALAQEDPEHFGHLSGITGQGGGLDYLQGLLDQSGARRTIMGAVAGLDRMRQAMGLSADKMGAGYQYLTNLVTKIGGFYNPHDPQSRLDYTQMIGTLSPLIEMAPKEFQGIAQMLLQPTIPGMAPPATKMGGQWQYGTPHKELWG